MRLSWRAVALAAAVIAGVLSVQGQQRPAFEVASVKPIDRNTMRRGHEGWLLNSETYVDRTELLQFIVRAYLGGSSCVMRVTFEINGYSRDGACQQLAGSMPAWIKSERWEIQAKLPPGSPTYSARRKRFGDTPEVNLMLQVLLEERFHLKVHWEKRDLPVYALTLGKSALKLSQTTSEPQGRGGIETVPIQDGTRRTTVTFDAASLPEAADSLSWYLDRLVVDRTGLKGDYDWSIQYEDDPSMRIPGNPFSGLTSSALSTALQAVGLRLESTRAPIRVLVIDHVEKPSQN
jgi:uncharacterized protein (TIGR03435 family)